MAPVLGDFDEIVGSNIAPEFRWIHGYYGMLNRLKIRPPVRLRNAADNLVEERATPTTVGEHDHSVSRGIPHHIALKDCRSAMLEVNLRRGPSYAHAQTPPDALRWPHACRLFDYGVEPDSYKCFASVDPKLSNEEINSLRDRGHKLRPGTRAGDSAPA